MPAKRTEPVNTRQRGAALMVMLVILVVGAAAIVVGMLSSSALQIERDKTTADALAKARDALIAYAVSDANRPGGLPCPDVNDDGMLTMNVDYIGSNCTSLIGRIPWKTLGLPELRDGNGEHLWYAVSNAFWANGSSAINSDTQGNLTVSGTTPASGVIAIVFAPGAALSGQNRSTTQSAACTTTGVGTVINSLCPANYLEGSNAISTTNTAFQTAAASSGFNDQMIYITHDALFQPVESRIAREAKNCLDAYATSSSGRYPWAASDNDLTYTGTYYTFFGRISATPNINIIPDSGATALASALSTLQSALNAYYTNHSPSNQTALNNAANNVISLKYSVPSIPSSTIDAAGDYGVDYANGSTSYTTASSYVNTAASLDYDTNMSLTWPSSCTLFTSTYWASWQREVFFQVARANSPGQNSCGSSCLTVNGSGNTAAGNGTYHAVVILGRAHNAIGTVTSDPPLYYLEGDIGEATCIPVRKPRTRPLSFPRLLKPTVPPIQNTRPSTIWFCAWTVMTQ